MRKRACRIAAGGFASLFLVFALSASQPMPVCAVANDPDCSEENTVMKCDGDRCCTVTKDTSEFCGCNFDPPN